MKALSLQEPYAWLILERRDPGNTAMPLKSIENRPKPLPSTIHLPQRIWIHASLGMFPGASLEDLHSKMTEEQWARTQGPLNDIFYLWGQFKRQPEWRKKYHYFGHLLGQITIIEMITESDSPWFTGRFGYVMRYPARLRVPIPFRGELGFFDVSEDKLGEYSFM